MLDDETKKALHEIRDALQEEKVSREVQGKRLTKLEESFEKHETECRANKETLVAVHGMVETMLAGMKITNSLRRAFLWCAPVIALAAELYRNFKRH